jgi:hypothetical protein
MNIMEAMFWHNVPMWGIITFGLAPILIGALIFFVLDRIGEQKVGAVILVFCILLGWYRWAWAADAKLTAITNLGAAPGAAGEFYLVQGGTDYAVTMANVAAYVTGTALTFSAASTISGNWVNTANPWADNEVSDDLSLDLLSLDALTSEPTEVVGDVYKADVDGGWDPLGSGGTTNDTVICTATDTYRGLWNDAGQLLVRSIDTFYYDHDADLTDTSTPHEVEDWELRNTIISNAGATGTTHYDQKTATTAGLNFIFLCEAAQPIEIDPNGSEQWYLNGTQLSTGEGIDNDTCTIGESITCISTDTTVYCKSSDANWVEESP